MFAFEMIVSCLRRATSAPNGSPPAALWIDEWLALPKLGAPIFLPHLFPCEDTELVISFPTFVAAAAQIRSFLSAEGAPPPPPVRGESSYGEGG